MKLAICEATSPLTHRVRYWVEELGKGPITPTYGAEQSALDMLKHVSETRRNVTVGERQYRRWSERPTA